MAATWIALALGTGTGTEGRAGSILVIGNLPQANDGASSTVAALGGMYAKAVGFTMGANSLDLDSVTLRLKEQAGFESTLRVQLYGGTTNPTGPVLASFNIPSIPTVATDVSFTPTSQVVLQASTSYWLYVTGSSNTLDGIIWYASDPGNVLAGVATSLGNRFTTTGAAPAALLPSSVTNSFQILGQAEAGPLPGVPEPPAWIPAATAVLAGLACAGWRQRRG
jgi:hypothetical protein